MARTQILLDSTSVLVRATFSRRPSSCTVDAYDHCGSQIVTAASATLGASAVFSSASGAGQSNERLAQLASVTSLRYRGVYVAINSARQQEAVQLLSCPASGACDTAERLQWAYAAGDALEEPSGAGLEAALGIPRPPGCVDCGRPVEADGQRCWRCQADEDREKNVVARFGDRAK
jgi:hypothetical protein